MQNCPNSFPSRPHEEVFDVIGVSTRVIETCYPLLVAADSQQKPEKSLGQG